MKTNLFICGFLFLVSSNPLSAQQKFDLYYLCIGSSHYLQDFTTFEKGFSGFNTVLSANRSAEQMSQLFDSFGAVRGQTFLSTETDFATRGKVLAAVKKLISTVQQDKKKNPLLVFYFCGHGLSEGFGWNLFMMPGNFRYNVEKLDATQMGEKSLYAGDVYDALEKAKIPFVMLLDCCYEGNEEKLRIQDFAYQESLKKMAELAKDAMAIVRNMNEYHEPNPVIFSTRPGTLAKVVTYPINGKEEQVGPLCRRTLLSLQHQRPVSLSQYVSSLLSPQLDKQTAPAVCHWEPASFSGNYMYAK